MGNINKMHLSQLDSATMSRFFISLANWSHGLSTSIQLPRSQIHLRNTNTWPSSWICGGAFSAMKSIQNWWPIWWVIVLHFHSSRVYLWFRYHGINFLQFCRSFVLFFYLKTPFFRIVFLRLFFIFPLTPMCDNIIFLISWMTFNFFYFGFYSILLSIPNNNNNDRINILIYWPKSFQWNCFSPQITIFKSETKNYAGVSHW